ncbi:hypothetical protein POTOM_004059 [Populus tomentosa]|uniref:Pentatricopeptide repeat-containing protein n=1 Tax=Populus tomentosa TaxID=118781 RepID=A0A8X8AJK5_POPTO|nr:hypothetical protein POTOM_004059 [Populus tomentosa]
MITLLRSKHYNFQFQISVKPTLTNTVLYFKAVSNRVTTPLENLSTADAAMLFDEMPERYTVSFVPLIQGYNQRFRSYDAIWLFSRFHGDGHELNPFVFSTVLKLLVIAEWTESGFSVHACVCKLAPLWMRIVGFKPNNFIFASMLKACVGLEVFDVGKAVHGHAFKTSYVEELFFGVELMDLYIKSGDVDDALRVFDEMPKGDVIPWSFMIAQYARSEHSEETIVLFCKMRQGLVLPNQITLASLQQAFAILVDLQFGKQIHYHIVKTGNGNKALSLFKDMLECQVQGSEVTYSSVLQACSDMYARCGSIRDARLAFNMLRECDQVSWSAMIAGYSVHGLCREAPKAFELMQETECKPDKSTTRMVWIFGRLGHLDKTVKLVKETPFEPSVMVWRSLLNACVVHMMLNLEESLPGVFLR